MGVHTEDTDNQAVSLPASHPALRIFHKYPTLPLPVLQFQTPHDQPRGAAVGVRPLPANSPSPRSRTLVGRAALDASASATCPHMPCSSDLSLSWPLEPHSSWSVGWEGRGGDLGKEGTEGRRDVQFEGILTHPDPSRFSHLVAKYDVRREENEECIQVEEVQLLTEHLAVLSQHRVYARLAVVKKLRRAVVAFDEEEKSRVEELSSFFKSVYPEVLLSQIHWASVEEILENLV